MIYLHSFRFLAKDSIVDFVAWWYWKWTPNWWLTFRVVSHGSHAIVLSPSLSVRLGMPIFVTRKHPFLYGREEDNENKIQNHFKTRNSFPHLSNNREYWVCRPPLPPFGFIVDFDHTNNQLDEQASLVFWYGLGSDGPPDTWPWSQLPQMF